MPWTVYLTRRAYKQLAKLPQGIWDLADLAVADMEEQGINPQGWNTLKTGDNEYRLRLNYRYRMRYRVTDRQTLEIEVFYNWAPTGGIQMNQALEIHHDLADVIVKPSVTVNQKRLKKMICSTLDQYLDEDRVPAKEIHDKVRERHGEYYLSTGYYLRLYRQRAELTQAALANRSGIRQHHLSEMENNKRVLGKVNAKKLAEILDCDYRKLL